MREYKTTEKIIKEKILVSVKCNICKKEITGKFWRLTTHHHDWGEDSIESFEYYDLCSRDCIDKALDEYMIDCLDSNTQFFELEQDSVEDKD